MNSLTNDRPLALVDVDGVLADFTGALYPGLRRAGYSASADILDDLLSTGEWEVLRDIPQEHVNAVVNCPGFCASISPLEGSHSALTLLRLHYEVLAVTAPFPKSTTGWRSVHDGWRNIFSSIHPTCCLCPRSTKA